MAAATGQGGAARSAVLARAPELCRLGATELAAAIRARNVSAREAMAAYLRHIEATNPAYNAIVSLRPREALLAEAGAVDARLGRGEALGTLCGLPMAIKDSVPTAGLRTTEGSPIFADFVPDADAPMVERIRRAGAIVIGKTNTPEFTLGSSTYNRVFGITRNAWDSARQAGGSSGGAAVALALRMLPVADGSDFGGSLRNPAAWNNVFGFRPSQGRVPSLPAEELFFAQMSTPGPIARSVGDLALLLTVQAGYDARAPLSLGRAEIAFEEGLREGGIEGTRIAWLADLGGHLPMEPGILALCEGALGLLAGRGCAIEPALPRFDFGRLWRAFVTLRCFAIGGRLGRLYDDPAKRAQMKPEARYEVEQFRRLSAAEVRAASVVRSDWYLALLALFARFDFLALPAGQMFPFPAETDWPRAVAGREMDSYHRWMEVMIGPTMSGCPTIAVPAGFGAGGLPMGLQLVGPPRKDHAVLRLAQAYEDVCPWAKEAP